MPTIPSISFRSVYRWFGDVAALRDVSFDVHAGRVTALLGPNGAGKTTLLRGLLGLDRPDAGSSLIMGRAFNQIAEPAKLVGALIDGAGFHPGRTAAAHLRAIADLGDLDARRVDDVLELVGLADVRDRRVGGFSLGMRQRLGLASALLADPTILVLDEPANGLDPAGMRWLRGLARDFTSDGGTILVSSHVLDEIEHVADDVVVLADGVIRAHSSLASVTAAATVVVRSPDLDRLLTSLGEGAGASRPAFAVMARDGEAAQLTGIDAETVGHLAAARGIVLYELRTEPQRLEDVFLQLTGNGPEST